MIELVQEGVTEPTAEQVSLRAGVAMRTVFRHFAEMETLYREISRRIQISLQPLLETRVVARSWQDALDKLIDKRVRLYEACMPMRLAADALRHRSRVLQQDHDHFVDLARRNLHRLLPPELRQQPVLFEALDALVSYEMWLRLRREQGLSAARAREVIRSTARRLTAIPEEPATEFSGVSPS